MARAAVVARLRVVREEVGAGLLVLNAPLWLPLVIRQCGDGWLSSLCCEHRYLINLLRYHWHDDDDVAIHHNCQ